WRSFVMGCPWKVGVSGLRSDSRDEGSERRQLLFDKATRGFIFEFAGLLVELGRTIADEYLRLVQRKGVEKHHRLAQVVLYTRAADRSGRNRLQRHRLGGEGLV